MSQTNYRRDEHKATQNILHQTMHLTMLHINFSFRELKIDVEVLLGLWKKSLKLEILASYNWASKQKGRGSKMGNRLLKNVLGSSVCFRKLFLCSVRRDCSIRRPVNIGKAREVFDIWLFSTCGLVSKAVQMIQNTFYLYN